MEAESDVFKNPMLPRVPGRGPTDPRTQLEKLRVGELRNRCAALGYVEALGTKKYPNGDWDAWTADRCRQVLNSGVDINNRTRKLGMEGQPVQYHEMTRFDLFGGLAKRGLIPPPGVPDATMRDVLMQIESAIFNGVAPPPAPDGWTRQGVVVPIPVVTADERAALEPKIEPEDELPVEKMTMPALRKRVKQMGFTAKPTWKADELRRVIKTGRMPDAA